MRELELRKRWEIARAGRLSVMEACTSEEIRKRGQGRDATA